MDTETSTAVPAASWRDAASGLVGALEARGLAAEVCGHGAVRARNPACGPPDPGDAVGRRLGPGLQQEVLCRTNAVTGTLWWFWAWSGPERGSAPDLEPLCPLEDTWRAAERIAHVLAVPAEDSGDALP
ncbi:hypothetical protein ACFY4C_08220 [Actinomadura viridis]|uniref:hypothetical protein n=1 Tax=Actinomadura viridis TaxID=58110 RepID=UPI0036BAD046